VALLGLAVVSPHRCRQLRAALSGLGPALGAVVAVVATAGSLWFSEGAHFPPCELCWYQRIAMYPLAVILTMAAVRRDGAIRPYGIALAGLGAAVSTWHNAIETFPSLDGGGCDPTNPCTLRWVEGLGVWTIPRMALVAFGLVLAALLLDDGRDPEDDRRAATPHRTTEAP
jgi:disulfide bond formation protein DsbB